MAHLVPVWRNYESLLAICCDLCEISVARILRGALILLEAQCYSLTVSGVGVSQVKFMRASWLFDVPCPLGSSSKP